MYRHFSKPRKDWRKTVESQGLTFPTSKHADGSEVPYWFEEAVYELSMDEVEHMEEATEQLHRMCVEAARYMASGELGSLGLPPGSLELARESLKADPPSVYGRFDLRFDGTGPVKLLEYNGDTPTGLIETASVQWFWLQDKMPSCDQWNSVHERLVMQWTRLAHRLRSRTVHFAYQDNTDNHEEWMTATYLRDTAMQAGLATVELQMTEVGFDTATRTFVDLDGRRIDVCFKLYPWEDMLVESFGRYIVADPDQVQWIEPLWKVLLSNKAMLVALWRIYPDHEYLLPAYLDDPGPLSEWIAKPLHGREGDGIRVRSNDFEYESPERRYGAEGYCYQAWCPLPSFDGNHPVIGSWVIDGKSAGAGIRESDGYVTDYYARFVPHVIDAPLPDEEQQKAWLAE